MSAIAMVGLEPAAVTESILELDLGARAPLRLTRVGNGNSNLVTGASRALGKAIAAGWRVRS